MQVYQGSEGLDGKRVYVGNINYEVREAELRTAFQEVCLGTPALALCAFSLTCASRRSTVTSP